MPSTRAIVLSREAFGEADLYVQFLTKDWGVVTFLAKSGRKSKRRYVGGLDLFCHNEIFIKGQARERAYLQELVVLNSFSELRENLDRLEIAGRVLQWIKRLADIATPSPNTFSLLGQTLALVEKESDPKRLEILFFVFKLKLLSDLGLMPQIAACAKCHSQLEAGGDSAFAWKRRLKVSGRNSRAIVETTAAAISM